MNEYIQECSICLMPIIYGKPAWKIHTLDCGHYFHRRCILQWGKECPECRYGCKMLDLININCELHTKNYKRNITMKLRKTDTIDNIYIFIKEVSKISKRHIKMNSIELPNNTIKVCDDPYYLKESIQTYLDRRESIINKLLGFSTPRNITIHFDIVSELCNKIDDNPIRYKFLNINNMYNIIDLEDSFDTSSDEEIDIIAFNDQSCVCVLI